MILESDSVCLFYLARGDWPFSAGSVFASSVLIFFSLSCFYSGNYYSDVPVLISGFWSGVSMRS